MQLLRAKLVGKDPEKGNALESIPTKIKALIEKYPEDCFEFVIGELEEDPKKAKKAKYKNQKKVSTTELKGQKFTLQLKAKDVTVSVDKNGYVSIKEDSNESFLTPFSDFINEAKNIKVAEIEGFIVKVYCLGTQIKIECEDKEDAEVLYRIFRNKYESVYHNEDTTDVELSLLPSEILKLFLLIHTT